MYPDTGQRTALAEAFGCARVVFDDAVRAREDAREAGAAFPTAGELSKRLITAAKQTPSRAWLGEVSSVVLQQSLREAEAAYKNFFASLKGERKGAKTSAPRFKSRKDNRQSIRFTTNARWSVTDSGRLNLPKVGAVKVKWSRTLPAQPSSVTVIKDAAGRYFASFVIETDPAADATRMPDTGQTVGIDLGLTHFAVLSDGTKTDSPRFLRRAEKKLKKAQRELSRKQKGSRNREKARQEGRRSRAEIIPPFDFWTAACDHAPAAALDVLGDAAWDRGLYRDAAQLHHRATANGSAHAAAALLDHLCRVHGTVSGAARHVAAHAALHDASAVAFLLKVLTPPGRPGPSRAPPRRCRRSGARRVPGSAARGQARREVVGEPAPGGPGRPLGVQAHRASPVGPAVFPAGSTRRVCGRGRSARGVRR
ncbi:RNA-guided endonuclease InsQ/TnpB family protein [Streptomyces bobili]|uniref:RNA-guided endonuclease InsQ/TnpB family protein n=1 Tax=Streptomyces bobili TaxID=67280 RepID=UPI00382CB7DF